MEIELDRIVDALPAFLWTALPDGQVDHVNRTWSEYTGLSPDDARGQGWQAVVHPDERHDLLERWRSMCASGKPGEMEARLRRSDGEYHDFLMRTSSLRDAAGRVIRWCVVATDIEQQRQAEDRAKHAVRESERESRSIVDSIPGLVALLTASGDVELVNPQLTQYFGQTLEELRQWATNGSIHPADLPHVVEVFRRSIASSTPYEIVQRFRRWDGVYRWFENSGFPLRDADGRVERWCVLLTDIDERKRAEAKLKRAYSCLAEAQRLSKTGSFVTDLVADERDWSDEAFRIFEFDPATKITLEAIRASVHPEDLPAYDAASARAHDGLNWDLAFRIITSAGHLKHLHAVGHVMENAAGRPIVIGAIQDVTERKIGEEALNAARSELAHVARVTTVGALTASIAHEVNQPLSGIITNASTCLRMLDADPPNVEGARETARRIIRDGNRASDVIRRLRAIFTGRELTLESLDLNEAAREVGALSLRDIQRGRAVLHWELADDLPLITGDRVQLQQVIYNLLRNAVEAMKEIHDRPRQMWIRTERDGDDQVRVIVRDVGVGIDRGSADQLFDTFYTTKRDGMGVGLSVSRSIVERHHGRIWAAPNEGAGATFAFSIPSRPKYTARVADDAPAERVVRPLTTR